MKSIRVTETVVYTMDVPDDVYEACSDPREQAENYVEEYFLEHITDGIEILEVTSRTYAQVTEEGSL